MAKQILWLKACPKCKGDIKVEFFTGGADYSCLQCGFLRVELDRKPWQHEMDRELDLKQEVPTN